ncbi:MAG: hypothetical protein U0228_03415 [Myxococcaceae bacterium]
MIRSGAVTDANLTEFLSRQYGVPAVDLRSIKFEADAIALVPRDVAEKHLAIPIRLDGAALLVALSDPSNVYAVDDLKFLTGKNIEAVVASEPAIRAAIARVYPR